MSWQLIASGGIATLPFIEQYETEYDEGDKGLLELALTIPIGQSMAQELENQLVALGVEGVRVETGSPLLRVYWTKGFPWLPVIVAAIFAFTILAILIVSWRLFKDVPSSVIPVSLGLIAVIVLGLAVLRRTT